MSTNSEIVEKIRKLLRLARSSNAHEAQLAMRRALELAREHDVVLEGLNPDEQAKEKAITHRDTEPRERLSYDKEYAVLLCQRFFRISAVFRDKVGYRRGWPVRLKYVSFIGTTSDIEIALYVYGFLVHHFAFSWRKHRGRFRNRHAFVEGMYAGIYSKLRAAEPLAEERNTRGDELVLADHQTYIGAVIGKTEEAKSPSSNSEASAARWAGFTHGQNTNIASGLKSGASAPLQLK